MKMLHMAAYILLWVGGVNWGLSVFGINLVEMIFGALGLTNIVYLLVGASAVYTAATHMNECKVCSKK